MQAIVPTIHMYASLVFPALAASYTVERSTGGNLYDIYGRYYCLSTLATFVYSHPIVR